MDRPNPDDSPASLAESSYCQRITQGALELPLHQFLGMELVEQSPGAARLRLPVGPATVNLAGVLHGGVIYSLLDVACFLALAPRLQPGVMAVTCDIHVSVMKAVPRGAVLELTGAVTRLGRSLAFCWGEASFDGQLAATARVTKSLVKARP